MSNIELSEESSTFFVGDKIEIVEDFLNEIPVLDNYINPNLRDHKFLSIIDELINLATDEEKAIWSSISGISGKLRSEGDKLIVSFIKYRTTPNPLGGAEFLDQSSQQL